MSRLQWHPFTVIAGDQPNTYIAYIKACGGWTRSLISRYGCVRETDREPETLSLSRAKVRRMLGAASNTHISHAQREASPIEARCPNVLR